MMKLPLSSPNQYSNTYRELCFKIYDSFTFTKVDRSSTYDEWKEWLSDSKLTLKSPGYSSSGGGFSGGHSVKRSIDLCSKGYFTDYSYSDFTISGYNASAGGSDSEQGSGTWELKADAYGDFMLVLRYGEGEVRQYSLEYKDDGFYMNGSRYFVTSEGEFAPSCD